MYHKIVGVSSNHSGTNPKNISPIQPDFPEILDHFLKRNFHYQPKQCTIIREIPQNYHTFALFYLPQNGWHLMTHVLRVVNLRNLSTHPVSSLGFQTNQGSSDIELLMHHQGREANVHWQRFDTWPEPSGHSFPPSTQIQGFLGMK